MSMRFKIKQLNDYANRHAGYSCEDWRKAKKLFDLRDYEVVYEGEIVEDSTFRCLELIYKVFNFNHPRDFQGHSVTVSDVIELDGKDFYCDSSSWVDVRTGATLDGKPAMALDTEGLIYNLTGDNKLTVTAMGAAGSLSCSFFEDATNGGMEISFEYYDGKNGDVRFVFDEKGNVIRRDGEMSGQRRADLLESCAKELLGKYAADEIY